MPPQALALAFAASIYPPAVAAVIALGRGPRLRARVFAFVAAACMITFASGALMLFLLEELGATSTASHTASAALELALGVLLLALAVRLRRRPSRSARADSSKPSGPSRLDRYLHSSRMAFLLGLTLYVVPSPIYIGAAKDIADAKLSSSQELLALAATVAVMLWLIEIPALALLIVPVRAERALGNTNRWFARNGRSVGVVAAAAAGAYLAIKGLAELAG